MRSLLSKSYFSLKCNLPKLGPDLGLPPINNGPSCLVYRSGWIAPRGLAGGTGPAISGVCPLDGMCSGDKHLPKLDLEIAGMGELQEELEPPIEAKLDCEGDGVRISPPTVELPGDEHLISSEAALSGDGDLLAFLSGKLEE